MEVKIFKKESSWYYGSTSALIYLVLAVYCLFVNGKFLSLSLSLPV